MPPPPVNLSESRLTGSKGQRYFLQRMIGQGNFATVYRCFDENDPLRTKYSCKVISKAYLDSHAQTNLIREIGILREVHHDNVLTMHDLLETNDYLFIVMPYMGGGELFEKISQRGHFSERDARDVLIQIARGIEYIHSRGICHRDIKPENILCTEEPEHFRVVISDFGLSKLFGRGELMTTSCGTLHYAAPEVLQHREYNEACDIWGFGVVAYVLLTGSFPFASSRDKLPALICSGRYNKRNLELRHISKPACDFIARMIVVDPRMRPTATEILRDPWLTASEIPHVDLTASAGGLGSLSVSGDDEEPVLDDSEISESGL